MIGLLTKLQDWHHDALFFANTFPLAYHFAWLKQDPTEIKFSAWNGAETEARKVFYYGSKPGAEDANASFVPVTIFQPKFVFVENNLAARRIVDGISKRGDHSSVSLHSFLNEARQDFSLDQYPVEIYAELDVLGSYLVQRLSTFGCTSRVYCSSANGRLPLIRPFGRESSLLRLFIYGGPLSTYLKRKDNHYIVLSVDDDEPISPALLETGIWFSAEASNDLKEAIREYHTALYAAAKGGALAESSGPFTGQCPPFYSVRLAYNEVAWLLQHRSSFMTLQEYAECLWDHHYCPTGNI